MFSVDQKVCCVDAAGDGSLTLGAIYTISQIMPEKMTCWRGVQRSAVGLWFYELSTDAHWGYAPERFRPIVERKTSIEIFKKMLSPTKEKETSQCRTGSSTG